MRVGSGVGLGMRMSTVSLQQKQGAQSRGGWVASSRNASQAFFNRDPCHRVNNYFELSMNPPGTDTVVLYDQEFAAWLWFESPKLVITAARTCDVASALARAEYLTKATGLYAAGCISYEAAPGFDKALRVRKNGAFPLLWLGLFDKPRRLSPSTVLSPASDFSVGPWKSNIGFKVYKRNIARIKRCIARGETYQVNYTYRLRALFSGNEWSYFTNLASAAGAPHAAYINTGRFAICSLSPELFFRLKGTSLISRPMKGTAPRGRFTTEDLGRRRWLERSEKNKAENIMIVDMVRNDMGRVANKGTVAVENLFACERFPTVWQMTSTVTSQTHASVTQIMQALFPCASITGAPKVSTANIISRLETSPRRIYTGCIGYIAPRRKAVFSVAIRTVLIDKKRKQAEYGAGGGIVWPSSAQEEFEECRVKALNVTRETNPFSLLESILWTPRNGFFLLDKHIKRLTDSAAYFGFRADALLLRKRLGAMAGSLALRPHKVRVVVNAGGGIVCTAVKLDLRGNHRPVRLSLARRPVDSSDCFLFHKTTNRAVYERAAHGTAESDDVVLWNERGQITETCIANVVVKLGSRLVTPSLECGLLAGTLRELLLQRRDIAEGIVTRNDLAAASKIYVVNSVRLWREAILSAHSGARGVPWKKS